MTTEVKDVVSRLRAGVQHKMWDDGHGRRMMSGGADIDSANSVMEEAASLLESLSSQVEVAGGQLRYAVKSNEANFSRATAAEGRVALLEEALALCAGVLPLFIEPSLFGTSVQSAWAQAVAAEVAARQALGLPMKADAE